MEIDSKNQIKFKEWLISKGLEPDTSIFSEHWIPFLREIGWSSESIKGMERYRDGLKARGKKAEKTFKNLERYIPLAVTIIILFVDYIANFLSKDFKIIFFIALGIEILVIFIKNTVKKAITENKEELI